LKNDNFQEARDQFDKRKDEILKSRMELYQFRSDFVNYFTKSKIEKMEIIDYVLGVPRVDFNFCYGLERKLEELGRIDGSTAFKFGAYYGRTKLDENRDYRFAQRFGTTYQEAFKNIKKAIINLLNDGENEYIGQIVKNQLSPMFKGKILSTYFPEKYLNIFSNNHLYYYLDHLKHLNVRATSSENLVYKLKSDPVYKREKLMKFKNDDPVMKNWPVDLFAVFLWSEYPGRPPKKN